MKRIASTAWAVSLILLVFLWLGAIILRLGNGGASAALSAPPVFVMQTVDATMAGDVKLVGDLDGDGFPDLVIGGMPNEKLNWYRYPAWQKTVVAIPHTEFTTDGRLGDVDGDGDLDIVVPDGPGADNLLWYENPRPTGDPTSGAAWQQHTIGSIGSWGKDVHLADLDGNGRLDVIARESGWVALFFQTAADQWQRLLLIGYTIGVEGLTIGDIDRDSHVDLVLQGAWLRNPGGSAARQAAGWLEYPIGPAPSEFKALVADIDGNGQPDVLFSSSEGTADVNWWTPTSGDPRGNWTKQTLLSSVTRAHTLQAADLDLDGDLDAVVGRMHTGDGQIVGLLNLNGAGTSWQQFTIGSGGLHNGVLADIDRDGDFDLYGANWTGNPPLRIWWNQLDPAVLPTPSLTPTKSIFPPHFKYKQFLPMIDR